jgi:hypothetical protein
VGVGVYLNRRENAIIFDKYARVCLFKVLQEH